MSHRSFRRFALRAAFAASLSLGLLLPVAQAGAQTVVGKWVAYSEKLDNGEANPFILTLKDDGDNKVSGTLEGLGFSIDVKGTVSGSHFELANPWEKDDKPFLVGDAANGELHFKFWSPEERVGKPFTPADAIKLPEYIAPPAIHPVPYNGLAKTPPMGWNSWNKYQGKITDAIVRQMADVMVSSGMRDAGYVYLNIDDTWEGERDSNGVLQPNHKFPDMKALADYVHSKGLKFGIYSSPGPRTCGGYPGSYGHEEIDAKTWAGWGIDFVKYDWCSAAKIYKDSDLQAMYQKMGAALQASGRKIIYSLCEYGMGDVGKWGPSVGGNMWRTTGDISDEWKSMEKNGFGQNDWAQYAAPGHWNDPDMLEIGNGHMTADEYRTHMSLWAILASPLLAGNDLTAMTPETKSILLNKEVIAIDQDALGKQGTRLSQNVDKNGGIDIWTRPLAGGGMAVGVFNRGGAEAKVSLKASDLKLSGNPKARDLWAHKDVAFKGGAFEASVPMHGVLLLKVGAK